MKAKKEAWLLFRRVKIVTGYTQGTKHKGGQHGDNDFNIS